MSLANAVTFGRLLLMAATVPLLYSRRPEQVAAAAVAAGVVIAADALDGWVARRRGEASRFGAILDIAGDRAVEAVYLTVFAHRRVVPLWPVLLVLVRGFLVDAVHAAAAGEGRTPFGQDTHLRGRLARAITASRASRAAYGALKAVTFAYLGLALAWRAAVAENATHCTTWRVLRSVALALTVAMTGLNLARGLAVLYEGRHRFLVEEGPAIPPAVKARSPGV